MDTHSENVYFLKKDPTLQRFYINIPTNGNTGSNGEIGPAAVQDDFTSNHIPAACPSGSMNSLIPLPLTGVNIGINLQTRGTGPFTRGIGGNCRGAYSTDLQSIRSSETQVASGEGAVIAGGRSNTASGVFSSVGGGEGNIASGVYSTVMGGKNNVASGINSVVLGGEDNIASTISSGILGGIGLRTNQTPYSAVVGRYNRNADRIFVVGNGASNISRSNAFSVSLGGTVHAAGSYNSGGADFGEYFESQRDSERAIPIGTPVTLIEGTRFIREAVQGERPLGVVSNTCSFVGNEGDEWHGKYLRDNKGDIMLDDKGERRLSPTFDPEKEYIPRSIRPEWHLIGLLGQVKILKGAVVAQHWIRMGSVDDTYDLWFIR